MIDFILFILSIVGTYIVIKLFLKWADKHEYD